MMAGMAGAERRCNLQWGGSVAGNGVPAFWDLEWCVLLAVYQTSGGQPLVLSG